MDKILCTSPYMQQKHGRSEHFESWQLVLWYFLHPGFFGVAKRARADRTNPGQCHSWTLVEPSVYQLCLGYICSISHFWYPQKIWIGPAVQCRKREGLWKRCLQSGTDPTDPQGRGGMFAGPWGGGHPVWMLYKVLQELEKGRFHPLMESRATFLFETPLKSVLTDPNGARSTMNMSMAVICSSTGWGFRSTATSGCTSKNTSKSWAKVKVKQWVPACPFMMTYLSKDKNSECLKMISGAGKHV